MQNPAEQAALEYERAAEVAFSKEDDTPQVPQAIDAIGPRLWGEFSSAETARRQTELRWLNDLRQYRGKYEPDELAKMAGRSQAFLRKTRTKVETLDARMADLLFPASREKNFAVKAPKTPVLPEEDVSKLAQTLTVAAKGQAPTPEEIKAAVKDFSDKAASKMEDCINDQLTEAKYKKVARKVLHSGHLYGTGILKGPLVERKVRTTYVRKGGKWVVEKHSYVVPYMQETPVWRFYPDMEATCIEDCRYVWEHHVMTREKLAQLAERKGFRSQIIRDHIKGSPQGSRSPRTYESELRAIGDRLMGQTAYAGTYDVFERWGWIPAEDLRACGVEIPEERMHETFFANVWILGNGQLIRAVLPPIDGMLWPYHIYECWPDETSFFGEGIPSIMRDDQSMLNAGVRAMLDNSALTSGPMLEVFTKYLSPESRANATDIHAWKVFLREDGDPQYPVIRSINIDPNFPNMLKLVEMFDENTDETTAIPKLAYDGNPQQGAANTMGGYSMMLATAAVPMKDLASNYDDLTESFLGALYHWNMTFSKDDSIKGAFSVEALGAKSLVAKEIRAQMLAQFGATLQPEERPRVKWDVVLKAKAEANDMADLVMSDEEFAAAQNTPQAQQAAQLQQAQSQLVLSKLQGEVGELQGKIQKLAAEAQRALADAERLRATALNQRVEATYSAMQSAGVAAQSPKVAPAGDLILQSAGYQDATPQGAPAPGTPMPVEPGANAPATPQEMQQEAQAIEHAPPTAHTGERGGIETSQLGDEGDAQPTAPQDQSAPQQ